MLDAKVMNQIKVARNEYEAALKTRIARDAKKTALANVLINNVVDIIETCLEAEDLFHMLGKERAKASELEKKVEELSQTQTAAPAKKAKNG